MNTVNVQFWHVGLVNAVGEAVECTECVLPVEALPQKGDHVRLDAYGTDEYPITHRQWVIGQDGELSHVKIDLGL